MFVDELTCHKIYHALNQSQYTIGHNLSHNQFFDDVYTYTLNVSLFITLDFFINMKKGKCHHILPRMVAVKF